MEKRLFLLDGMALVYRAHFAFITRPILDSSGRNTSAAFGFTNTLLELLDKRNPTHIAVAFDTSAPTARHEMFPEYKAQRDAMPEELAAAIPEVKELLKAFRIPVLELDAYEADDIIGTLARQAESAGYEEVFMVTPDKDYAQLVDEHTFMYKPGRKGGEVEILGIPEIQEQWGIDRPEQVIDILGLMGDSSDNIPGVPGVGPKTAQKLIAEFGSVDALLERVDEVKGKMREKLSENEEMARLSRKLVVIDCEVPLEVGPDDLLRGERDDEALKALFARLEFNTIGKRIFGDGFSAPATSGGGGATQGDLFAAAEEAASNLKRLTDVNPSYRCVEDGAEISALAKQLAASPSVCFDLETDSLDKWSTGIVGVAFSAAKGEGAYVPVLPETEEAILELLQPFWASATEKVGHNLKFDLGVLAAKGVEVAGPFADTMIAHSLLHPDQRHGMDRLAQTFLGYEPIPITDLIGPKGKGQKSMREVPVAEVVPYAVEDADITLQLWDTFKPLLASSGQAKVFETVEMPLLPVLMRMEKEGIRLDTDALASLSETLGARLEELEKLVKDAAGHDFNLNSPKQLGVVLFEELQLSEKPKKTKTGQYKTDEQTLQALSGSHPVIDAVLEFRELGKLKSTYVDALPKEVHEVTGRVHTQYLQTGAATGRLSSNHPNLQNIPIRTEQGREIRRAFIPRGEGVVLLAADYSQIELRLMAHMSGDAGLKEAFQEGHDIHQATAAKVYGVGLDEVTSDMRRKAKMVNFGIIYGISAFGLSQRLDVPRKEAADIIDAYFEQYPGVKTYMDDTITSCRSQGYVETMCGRRREIRDIDSRNRMVREGAERTAINTPIQGSAADMIKLAMIEVDAQLRAANTKTRLLLQVHDELVFDLYEDEAEEWVPTITRIMEQAMPLDVPVVVEAGTGSTWLEAH